MRKINKEGILQSSFFRFLLVGGINTLVGYLVTLFFRYQLGLDYRLAQVFNFILCFPLAYSLQAVFAFQQKWAWKKLLIYPLSSIPNWIIQLLSSSIAVELFQLPAYLAYLISYLVPIPIMYLLVKFLVKNPKEEA